jgi:hypothetical protein
MNTQESLKQTERKIYQSMFADGLVDIGIGCFMLIFAIAPLLSQPLGDFWSSMIFLPFWGLAYLTLRAIRKNVVAPRVGTVSFGSWRKARLKRFNIAMLVLNIVLLLLGILAARALLPGGWAVPLAMGAVWLVGFSLGAFFLDYGIFYLYAVLFGLAPVIGEWLYLNAGFSHHGYPAAFGTACAVVFTIGLVKLFRLLANNPMPVPEGK